MGGRSNKTTYWAVLRFLSKGYHRDFILKSLNISASRFYKLRSDLQRDGFLDSTFMPCNIDIDKTLNQAYAGCAHGGSVSCGKFVRLHRVQIKIPVFRWFKDHALKPRVCFGRDGTASYWKTRLNDCTVMCFKKSLTVYLPQFWGDNKAECDSKMFAWFLEWLQIARGVLGFYPVRSDFTAEWLITKREYAYVGAENARRHVAEREVIRVVDKGGQLHYVVDQSLGVPEFEAVHPVKSGSDAQKFEQFYNDVLTGKYAALRVGVADLGRIVEEQAKIQASLVKILVKNGLL